MCLLMLDCESSVSLWLSKYLTLSKFSTILLTIFSFHNHPIILS